MSVAIRIARTSDAADIARLTRELGYEVPVSAVAERLTRILTRSDERVFVADVDGHVAGWLHAAIADSLETDAYVGIAGLVVESRQRRRGVGRMLMSEAESWAKEQQCSVVRLRSTAARTAAHRFYETLGYSNIKTQYSFVKALDGRADFSRFIPRIDKDPSGSDRPISPPRGLKAE
jgi:GNAT superfamily N-acetyltransferase